MRRIRALFKTADGLHAEDSVTPVMRGNVPVLPDYVDRPVARPIPPVPSPTDPEVIAAMLVAKAVPSRRYELVEDTRWKGVPVYVEVV